MKQLGAVFLLVAAAPASGEVISATQNGFDVRQTVTVPASPTQAFAEFAHIGSWWSSQHSFSGNAANLTLDLQPGGCFCERLPAGGGVQHMHVSYLEPAKRVVLTGSLGPLLFLATTGVMDVQFAPGAKATQVTMEYRVSGLFDGGADKMAPAVDRVLSEQLQRYAAYVTNAR